MTLPAMIRVFFAVNLPASTKQQLTSFISQLKKKSKLHAIRWIKPENRHITLHFLPEVQTIHLPLLLEKVQAELCGTTEAFTIRLEGVSLFPNPFRPRVITLSVVADTHLINLATAIGKGIQKSNYAIEERPFRPHLTLGRIKYSQGVNLNFLTEYKNHSIENIPVNEIVLFRSEPQPEGSKYMVLEKIML